MTSENTEPEAEQSGPGVSRPVAESTADIQWVNTGEAAKRLGVTTRTLYRFIDEGQLAAYRFGRVIRLKENDIAGFIDDLSHRARHARAPLPRVRSGQGLSPPRD